MHDLSTTLVAVATAPGRGGIGCVRLSGERSREIASSLFRARSAQAEGPAPRFGVFLDEAGRAIDHGFLVEFPPDRSFTGESAIELWAHGSPPILSALVRAAIRRGAVAAGPGEFTYRALRRGRLDLSRAEAVRNLVAARTFHQARVAFAQIEGAAARRVAPLRDRLLDLLARGEAAVEFVDESEAHLGEGAIAEGIAVTLDLARELLEEARRGRVVREGARVAICGVTSVGKSSLFNRLLGRERAIVSPVPGTTRDTLEETLDLEGIPVTVVDTAGLREATDAVEAEGVRRARVAAGEADLLLLVVDASRAPRADERAAWDQARSEGRPCLVAANKIDLGRSGIAGIPRAFPISVRTGEGWEAFRDALRDALLPQGSVDLPALTDARHVAALEAVVAALEVARGASRSGYSDEAVLLDVREALDRLGEISGDVGSEELYDKIFSTFCIGK